MLHIGDQETLVAQAADLVAQARAAGADACDAVVSSRVSLSADIRDGVLEESTRAEGDSVSLRIFVGQRVASVSANSFTELSRSVERGIAMARAAPEDPFAHIADAARLAAPGDIASRRASLDLFDPTFVDATALAETARRAEEAVRAVSGVRKSGGASAAYGLTGVVLATSAGFASGYVSSRFSISATAISGEGTAMERDYAFDTRTHVVDLDDAETIGTDAGVRAVRRLGGRKIASRTAPVLFDARVARGLLSALAGAINGRAIARKTSFLLDAKGTRVFAPGIRIDDNPFVPRGVGSRPFDGEGLTSTPLAVVEDGFLNHWLLDLATARELGVATNARATRGGAGPTPSTTNFILSAGSASPGDLMREVGAGLLVTDLIGRGVNGVTGDYSCGAAGFWFERGEIAYPVSEITIAGNLRNMFAHMIPANDMDARLAYACPSILIESMTIAGE